MVSVTPNYTAERLEFRAAIIDLDAVTPGVGWASTGRTGTLAHFIALTNINT